MTNQHAAIQAVFFDLERVLVRCTRPRQELAIEGAQRLARWLQAQEVVVPADLAEQWLAARRFAAAKALQEQTENPADDVLAFVLQVHGCRDLPSAVLAQAVDLFFYPQLEHCGLVPGAREALVALREGGRRLGVICNASSDRFIQSLVEHLGIRPYLDLVLTSAAARWRKPRREIFEMALQRVDALGYEAVMVGGALDVMGAQAAGMWSVLIERPADVGRDIVGRGQVQPDAAISSLMELLPLVERWSRQWSWEYADEGDAAKADDEA